MAKENCMMKMENYNMKEILKKERNMEKEINMKMVF